MSPDSDSVLVPFVAPVAVLVCPLLHCIVHVNVFPSGSLIGMLQVRLTGLPVDIFVGEGIANVGGLFVFVVNVYDLRVYSPLPLGSVAFTQILYVVEYASPDSDSVLVPFVAPVAVLCCPLLQLMFQLKGLASVSLIRILQVKLSGFPIEPFVGDGVPKTGLRFAAVVKVYHLRVYIPLPLGSVAFTQIL